MNPAAVLTILVEAQTGRATTQLRKFNAEVATSGREADKSSKAMGGKLAKGLKLVGIAAGVGAAYGLYKAVDAGATFERQMSSLGSVSQASAKQIKAFEQQALKLGESTQYTANQVAEAQTELAKGGLTAKQILGGALSSALSLAAAGQLELAQAAETTVNVMKLFGLQAKDTGQIADMLATAANKTTADVSDFAMALKQGGSVAKLAGLSLNETVTILESLAEAGIKNSDAGTSMKVFFQKIGNPSVKAKKAMDELNLSLFDQEGRLKKLPAVSAELQRAFGDLTKEQFLQKAGTIAGTDSIRTLYALYAEGPKKIKGLEKANAKNGTAAKVASEKMDNLQGDWEQFTGALETGGIKLYQVLKGPLRSAVEWMTEAAQAVGNFDYGQAFGEVEEFYEHLHDSTNIEFAGASFSLFPETAELEESLQWLENASKNTATASGDAWQWLENATANTFHAIAAGVKWVEGAFHVFMEGIHAFTGAVKDGVDWIKRAASNVAEFVSSIIPLKIAFGLAYIAVKTLVQAIQFGIGVVKVFMPLYEAVARVVGTVLAGAFHVAMAVIQTFLKFIGNVGSVIADVIGVVTNLLRGKWGNAWKDAKQLVVDVWHTIEDVIKGAWTVLKTIFTEGFGVLKSILKNAFTGIKGTFENVADFIGSVFESGWEKAEGVFTTGANAVIGVINAIISAIDVIPGVNIGKIAPLGGSSDHSNRGSVSVSKKHRSKAGYQTGGFVHAAMGALAAVVPGSSTGDKHLLSLNGRPIAKVESREGIFVGNRKAMGAAKALNDSMPRFQQGGAVPGFDIGGILESAGEIATAPVRVPAELAFDAGKGALSVAKVLGSLPSGGGIPEPFSGVGPWAVDKVKDWIKNLPSSIFGGGSPAGSSTGPNGIGSYQGVPMADWVIESLRYAAGHGSGNPQPTSGYRSPDQVVTGPVVAPQGHSEHQGTQYPHGAVDFGGPFDSAALAKKMAVVNATKSFKYPLLAPIGFEDDGHASGTGHQRGGLVQMLAKGGAAKSEGTSSKLNALLTSVWGRAASLYGQASGSPFPGGDYEARGLTRTEGDVGKVEGSPGHKAVFFDKGWANQLLRGTPYAEESLLHEWAHVFQKGGLKRWEAEGGATDFERWAAPQVFGGDFSNVSYPRGYKKLADRVKDQLGDDWITKGQFGRQRGGLVASVLQKLQSGGAVVKTVGSVLARNGLDLESSGGVLGSSYGESGWNTEAMENPEAGGLWGFTASPVSLDDEKAYAASRGKAWGDAATQTQFMLHHFPTSMRNTMNSMSSIADATTYFVENWEHPETLDSLPTRIEYGEKAAKMLQADGIYSGKGGGHQTKAEETAGTYKEKVPAEWHGCKTGSLSLGSSTPKSLEGIHKELAKRRAEVEKYRHTADKASAENKPAIAHAIQKNVTALEVRIRELDRARAAAKREAAKKKITKHLNKALGRLFGNEQNIELTERAFNEKEQTAQQIVELEPVMEEFPSSMPNLAKAFKEQQFNERLTGYINNRERPAYMDLFGLAANWRNSILRSEHIAAGNWEAKGKPLGGLEGNWETQIFKNMGDVKQIEVLERNAEVDQKKTQEDVANFKAKHGKTADLPDWLKKEVATTAAEVKKAHEEHAKLPMLAFKEKELRRVLGSAQAAFYPGGSRISENPTPPINGSGSIEEALVNLQGIHWPGQHESLKKLPTKQVAGQFGGIIWGLQNQLKELGLRMPGAVEIGESEFGGEESSSAGGEEVGGSSNEAAAEREKARNEWLEEELRKSSQRNAVFTRQKPIIDAYIAKDFAGMFAKGGSIPAGKWGIAGEAGPEPVFGPATVVSNAAASAAGPVSVEVHNYSDKTKVLVNDMEVVAAKVYDHKSRAGGRGAKTTGARNKGRIG